MIPMTINGQERHRQGRRRERRRRDATIMGRILSIKLSLPAGLQLLWHFRRWNSVNSFSTSKFATKTEKQALTEKYGLHFVQTLPVSNFVVWRRSALWMLVAWGIVHTLITLQVAVDVQNYSEELKIKSVFSFASYASWKENVKKELPEVPCQEIDENFQNFVSSLKPELPGTNPNCWWMANQCDRLVEDALGVVSPKWQFVCVWPDFCKTKIQEQCPVACGGKAGLMCRDIRNWKKYSYMRFAMLFAKSRFYQLISQYSWFTVGKAYLLMSFNAISIALAAKAASSWANWKLSRKWLFWSWSVMFLAPFLLSMIPIQRFVDVSAAFDKESFDSFLRDASLHFDVKNEANTKVEQAGELCKTPAKELVDKWGNMKGKAESICGDWIYAIVRLSSRVREGCKLFSENKETPEKGVKAVQSICHGLKQHWDDVILTGEDAQSDAEGFIRQGWALGNWLVEAAIGFQNSLSSMLILWPAAISVPNGLVEASLRMKYIFPVQPFPGLFVVTVPWLFAPLIWSVHNIVMQLVKSWAFYVQVVLFSFSSLMYSIMGLRVGIVSPMDQRKVLKKVSSIRRGYKMARLLMCGSFLFFLAQLWLRMKRVEQHEDGGFLPPAIKLLKQALLEALLDNATKNLWQVMWIGLSVGVGMITKAVMIELVGSDFMLESMSLVEQFGNLLENRKTLQDAGMLDKKLNVHGVAQLQNERQVQTVAIVEMTKMRDRHGRQVP